MASWHLHYPYPSRWHKAVNLHVQAITKLRRNASFSLEPKLFKTLCPGTFVPLYFFAQASNIRFGLLSVCAATYLGKIILIVVICRWWSRLERFCHSPWCSKATAKVCKPWCSGKFQSAVKDISYNQNCCSLLLQVSLGIVLIVDNISFFNLVLSFLFYLLFFFGDISLLLQGSKLWVSWKHWPLVCGLPDWLHSTDYPTDYSADYPYGLPLRTILNDQSNLLLQRKEIHQTYLHCLRIHEQLETVAILLFDVAIASELKTLTPGLRTTRLTTLQTTPQTTPTAYPYGLP